MQNRMELHFSSCPQNESFARVAIAAFAVQLNPTLPEMADIKTAVSEAVTNAIVHGYRDQEGMVSLCAEYGDRRLLTVPMRNVAQKAKAAGARVALLTASPSSALARDAHLRVVLPANTSGPSVQIGASAFEQSLLLLGDALIVLLADKLHIADPQSFMRSRHANWE